MNILAIALASLLGFCACGSGSDDKGNDVIEQFNLTASPESLSFNADGGESSINISSSREWSAFATNNETWFTVSPASGASGSTSIKVTVQNNSTYVAREGEITVKAGSERRFVKVSQEASMKVSQESFYTPSVGGTLSVEVTTTSEWKAESKAAWMKANKLNGKELEIVVEANDELKERESQVVVTYGAQTVNITVKQGSADDRNISAPEGYHLVWHDEFSEGTSLDTRNWRHEVQRDHWVNNELQNYVNEKSPKGQRVTEIVDGKLQIHCFKEDGKIYSGRVYGNSSKGWTYGYVEAKIKLPSGKGTWPAFWMMPVNFTSWPHDGEIDIMEEVGYHKDYVSSSLHADGHVHSNGTQVTKEVYCKGAEGEFHLYAMEWTADYFQFYVDGNKTLYYKNPGTGVRDWPYDAPFYVIFNLAWGGDWGGSQGVDESALPVTMEVEYVRVFEKD